MKTILAVLLFVSPVVDAACQKGFVPSDTPGVCVEKTSGSETTNQAWVSDEKPPEDKMPSWERAGVSLAKVDSTMQSDEDADKAKINAIAEGKKRAGIKDTKRTAGIR